MFDRGFGPQDALKKDSQGLSQVVAGNHGFPRLMHVTSGSQVPLRNQGYCGVGSDLSELHWVW